MATIRNPVEWSADQLKQAAHAAGEVSHSIRGDRRGGAAPSIRQIELSDLRNVLEKGVDDLGIFRSDVLFLCIIH